MNTFLPEPDLLKSAQCLNDKRLGKQRVEAMQILKINRQGRQIAYVWGKGKGDKAKKCLLWFKPLDSGEGIIQTPWYNHPAVAMWRGYETCLEVYMNLCIDEWVRRGFRNTMKMCVVSSYEIDVISVCPGSKYPSWFGNLAFHDSHKSNLLRKDYDYYKQFNWNVPNDLSYVWPV